MTPTELTGLLGVAIALASSVIVPLYLVRKGDARAKEERAQVAKAAKEAGEDISWVSINKALARERDNLVAKLAETEARYEKQIRELQERLDSNAQVLKQRYDHELGRANERIQQLSAEIDLLYRRLYQQREEGDAN